MYILLIIMTSITIKNYDKIPTESRLELHIKGDHINHTIVNTMRRIITSIIPIYAFNKFIFSTNTSIFNNNYIKLRMNNLPVLGIKTKEHIFKEQDTNKIEEDTLQDNNMMFDNLELKVDDKINSSSLDQLTMYIDTENKTSNIISVTTKDAKFYLREKNIPSPYKNNIQLIKLQPKQKIKMSCITDLNIEDKNSIYSAITICHFIKNKDNDYDFILESRGQLTEIKILNIMYDNIINQLDIFYNLIPDIKDMEGKISFNNMDHTLGNIISEGLQNHQDVLFGGYNMPHPLDNKIVITYKLEKNNIRSVIKEVIDKYKKIFTDINSKIKKL